MDLDLRREFLRATRRRPADVPAGSMDDEWRGTGLCIEAQADGVPCHETGRSCDRCARASHPPGEIARTSGKPAPADPGEAGAAGS